MNIDLTLQREELEGCLHLGMEREALRLAGRILRAAKLNSAIFNSAVNALLICEDRLARWLGRVESAFVDLSRRDQRKSAKMMFNFYVSLNRWTDAAQFLPRRPATAAELLFSMWTLLNLRRMDEAAALLLVCCGKFKRTEDEFERSCLTEAIAGCLAQKGCWDTAELFWLTGTDLWPFAPQAWGGLVKLHALRGLLKANEVFDFVRAECSREDSRASPNAKVPCTSEQLNELDVDFHRHAKHLAKVIPAKERWQFGL